MPRAILLPALPALPRRTPWSEDPAGTTACTSCTYANMRVHVCVPVLAPGVLGVGVYMVCTWCVLPTTAPTALSRRPCSGTCRT